MRTRNLSDGELLFSALDALRVALNCTEAVARPRVEQALLAPLLVEASDAARVAQSALLTLRERAKGVMPPKVGD